jgi:hypothetical protein
MSNSRKYRKTDGPARRRAFTTSAAPVLPSLWQRAGCCGAVIAADPSRMSKTWADVHEPGCPAPWEALGLDGEPREVYPLAPYLPAGTRLRAVNRSPGRAPASPGHQAALRRRA